MIKKIDHADMGRSDLGWLQSTFHFSFSEYYNPDNMNFGALRVLNDDTVAPGAGFDVHPHSDMEIITYVVKGELTHGDSMNNRRVLKRGDVQYMSAGTGVLHSELNRGREVLRFLQMWIIPDKIGLKPRYGDRRFPWEERVNKWLQLVSGEYGPGPIRIHRDVNIFVAEITNGGFLCFDVLKKRQAYMETIEGTAEINGVETVEKDAAEIAEEKVEIVARPSAHIIMIEMARP